MKTNCLLFFAYINSATREYLNILLVIFNSHTALAKAERKLAQDLLSTNLCQTEETFQHQIEEWDKAMIKMDNHMAERVSNVVKCGLPTATYASVNWLFFFRISFALTCCLLIQK